MSLSAVLLCASLASCITKIYIDVEIMHAKTIASCNASSSYVICMATSHRVNQTVFEEKSDVKRNVAPLLL